MAGIGITIRKRIHSPPFGTVSFLTLGFVAARRFQKGEFYA